MKFSRIALLLSLLLLAPAALADEITLVGGRKVTGSVTSETWEEVEYSKGRVRQKQPAGDVVSIIYSKTSKEYQEALVALASGKNIAAASLFVTAADDEDVPDHVAATALVLAGDALLANNNFADAQGVYDQLLSNFPRTRHLAPALMGKGKALFFTGGNANLKAAEAAFNDLKAQAADKGLGERFEREAEFYALWAGQQLGKDVIDEIRRLKGQVDGSDPALARKCALIIGRAHLAQGDGDRAKRMFEEIIENRLEAADEVVAGAFNGRGDCTFAQAKGFMNAGPDYEEDAAAAFREALYDYLRVYVSYKGVVREQPQALLQAGFCFQNIAALDTDAAEFDYRGLVLHKRLRDDYAWSKQSKHPDAQK